MAFNSAPGRAEYTAAAGQTVFPFVFKIYLDGDIKVYQTPAGQTPDDVADLLTITTDYTVTISGDNGGDITLVSGAALNDSITIVRDLDITRLIEYQTNGDMNATTLNQDQNYQTYLIADKDAENETHLRLPDSVQGVSVDLPAPVALNFLRWNQTANALENINSLQADGYLWTAADIYTKTESDTLLDLKANLAGANFTGLVGLNRSVDVASATVLPIPVNGNSASVTGTTTVTSIATTSNVGTKLTYTFAGILTLTHHATDLILPGGEDYTTAIGDVFEFEEYAAGDYRCTSYTKADGTSIISSSDTRLNTANEDYAGQAAGVEILNNNAGEWIKNQCTAWVNFEADGTINSSFNVSSVVKTAVGTWTITFATTMDNINYCVSGTSEDNALRTSVSKNHLVASTTTTISVINVYDTTYYDGIISIQIFGGRV